MSSSAPSMGSKYNDSMGPVHYQEQLWQINTNRYLRNAFYRREQKAFNVRSSVSIGLTRTIAKYTDKNYPLGG